MFRVENEHMKHATAEGWGRSPLFFIRVCWLIKVSHPLLNIDHMLCFYCMRQLHRKKQEVTCVRRVLPLGVFVALFVAVTLLCIYA